MRCHDVREQLENLWESEAPAEVRQHLAQCSACREYYRDLRLVRGGFRLLKAEEVPQPSLGFAERLIRRLGELSQPPSVADFFESVGRRFVYATLTLTFIIRRALALPPAGPVRGLSASDIQMPAVEASVAYSDPMGESGLQGLPELAPAESPALPAANEVK